MSRQFQVGDAVEVLPAPEGAGFTWRMVGRRRGTVGTIDCSHPLRRIVGVLFRNGDVYWCDPAWLRLVERREVILGSRPCDVCGEVVTLLPGQRMFETCSRCFMRLPPPSHDAPSRPLEACGHWQVMKLGCGAWVCKDKGCWQEFTQGGRHDPNHNTPSRPQDARCAPSEAKADSQAAPGGTGAATWNVLYTTNIPRFKEGDAVRYRGDAHRRHVVEVSLTPRYRLDGGDAWVREEDLRRQAEGGLA